MRKIGFIGAYDKTDLIINVAKILTATKKKVLIVDATILQKSRYIVPVINPTKMYVTEYEDIDVAIGFSNFGDIKKYLGTPVEEELDYDIVFVDTDNIQGYIQFDLQNAEKRYFVTSFDLYSLKKGLETLTGLENMTSLTKVYFSKDMLKEDDDYLNYLSKEYKIIWEEEKIYFPIENGDLSVIYENQRLAKVGFRKLSIQYKDGLAYIAEQILGNGSDGEIRRAIKAIEKGG
mgnify:FL=1